MKADGFCRDGLGLRENKCTKKYPDVNGGVRALLQSNSKKPGGHRAILHKWNNERENNIPQHLLQF